MLRRAHSIFRQSVETLRAHMGPRRYTALADPAKVIWIKPSDVPVYTEFWTKELRNTQVLGGSWDHRVKPIETHPIYRGLHQHFEQGIDWDNTQMFRTSGFVYLKRSETLLEKLKQRDALYDSIREHGILPNFTPSQPEVGRYNDGDVKNISVLIGRNGEIIFACRGWHRLCIAKILRLPHIPVQVLLRHSRWQRIREEFKVAKQMPPLSPRTRQLLLHPDLTDILPSALAARSQ